MGVSYIKKGPLGIHFLKGGSYNRVGNLPYGQFGKQVLGISQNGVNWEFGFMFASGSANIRSYPFGVLYVRVSG